MGLGAILLVLFTIKDNINNTNWLEEAMPGRKDQYHLLMPTYTDPWHPAKEPVPLWYLLI